MLNKTKELIYIRHQNHKANCFDSLSLKFLINQFRQASKNSKVGAIIFETEGTIFSAGASFQEFINIKTKAEGQKFFQNFGELLLAIKFCAHPVIIKVQGPAVGGAVGLIAAADYVIATKKASTRLSELSIGIGALVIEPFISAKIGYASFMEMSLDGESKDANWGQSRGLFQVVAKSDKDAEKIALGLGKKICGYSTEAIKSIKNIQNLKEIQLRKIISARAKTGANLLQNKETRLLLNDFLK